MRVIVPLGACWALAACPGPPPAATCSDLCDALMYDCGYAAFPDRASCEQGCRYDVSEGGDAAGLYACILEAGCDTPLVLECSRAYGGAP
ncbi:MAG: hypothetical protein R3F59_08620 [Myxococcota bacterium]